MASPSSHSPHKTSSPTFYGNCICRGPACPRPPSDVKADECCYGLLLGECKVRIGQASRFRPGSLCNRRPAAPLPGFLAGTMIGLGQPSDRPPPRALLRLPRRSPTVGLPHGAGPCFSLLDLRAFTLQRPDSDRHRHPYLSSARVKSHKHLLLGLSCHLKLHRCCYLQLMHS